MPYAPENVTCNRLLWKAREWKHLSWIWYSILSPLLFKTNIQIDWFFFRSQNDEANDNYSRFILGERLANIKKEED